MMIKSLRAGTMKKKNNQDLDWLLQTDHPSIRYLVKRDLLGETPGKEDTAALLAPASPIRSILDQIKEGEYWMDRGHFYSPKFFASHWSLYLLCEYGCPADLPEIQKTTSFLLQRCRHWLDNSIAEHTGDHTLACFYANVLRYAVAFGFADHPTTRDILTTLTQPKHGNEWRCKHNEAMPCSWGAIRTLWGLGILPQDRLTDEIQQTIRSATDLVLNSCEMLQTIEVAPQIKRHSLWDKTSFPLYYQADRLFTLRALRDTHQLQHKEVLPALQWLQARKTNESIWHGSNPFKSRSWPYGMDKENTDRWVTLQALLILKDAAQFHPIMS
jgi:hypothetical protein